MFLVGLTTLARLRNPDAVRSWLVGIAVHKAKKQIRDRRRARRLESTAPSDLPERTAPSTPPEASDALRATYRVLGQLPVDERIAFALRHIDGMELTELAVAVGASLATVKRRLRRAHDGFVTLAHDEGALEGWLDERTFRR